MTKEHWRNLLLNENTYDIDWNVFYLLSETKWWELYEYAFQYEGVYKKDKEYLTSQN